MKIVCLSDTHGRHREIPDLPDGDVLLHAGDACNFGTLNEIADFADWFRAQPHRHKILIAGNHDWPFHRGGRAARDLMHGIHYLEDIGCEVAGVRFWGSPWQPEFCNWAFNVPRGPELARIWQRIPADVQILATHGPAFSILDANREGKSVGCRDLLDRLQSLPSLRVHVFGHIHEGRGSRFVEPQGYMAINASSVDRDYQLHPIPWTLITDEPSA